MKKSFFIFLSVASSLVIAQVRDPLKQPFSSRSIWNMPIGSEAVYVPANLPAVPRGIAWSAMPQMDDEQIIFHPEADEIAVVRNGTGWKNPDRCNSDSSAPALHIASLPVPTTFVVPNSSGNNSASVLDKTGRFIYQLQPFTHCSATSPITALVDFTPVDIYGTGYSGAHGGSGLSAIGGSLRIGELRPGGQPPRHVMKVDVDRGAVLAPCSTPASCYRWPATTADSDATDSKVGYGKFAAGPIPAAMKMGALLALPLSVNIAKIGLETVPAQMLAWTLQNYGAYIVDSTGGAGFAIAAENGPDGNYRDQFQSDWNLAFEGWCASNTPWTRDMQRLVVLLSVVDNNGPNSIGGGGIPLQPLAPEISSPN